MAKLKRDITLRQKYNATAVEKARADAFVKNTERALNTLQGPDLEEAIKAHNSLKDDSIQ